MKPLSKKRRSFSLFFLFFVFIISIPVLLAYSAGYRVNWEDLSVVKTGGIFIHSDLSGVNIFIDDEYFESGGVLLRNVLVQNLKSNQSYKIRVEKEGYLPWYKELFIYPNIVTEGRILMLPIEIPFEKIEKFLADDSAKTSTTTKATTTKLTNSEYTEVFSMFSATSTPDRNLIVFEEEIIRSTTTKATSSKIIVPEHLAKLEIKDIEKKKQLRESNKIIAWLEAGDIQVFWTGEYESTPFYFCDIRDCKDNIKVSLKSDIRQFDFFPNRNDAFLVATGAHIFAIEADNRSEPNLQVVYEGKNPQFKLDGSTIFVKDGQELYKAEI